MQHVKMGRPPLKTVKHANPARPSGPPQAKVAKGPTGSGKGFADHRLAIVKRLMSPVTADEKADASYTHLSNDSKAGVVVAAVPRALSGDREFQRTLLGTKPIKTVLVQEFAASSGTINTAYAVVFPADICLCGDISSWLNLFDEMRCDGTEMRAIPYVGSSSTSQPVQPLVFTAAFDPDQAAAVTSNQANLKSTRHIGPIATGLANGVSMGAGQYVSCIIPTTHCGYISLHSGPLMRSVLPGSSGGVLQPNPVQGAWVPTTTSSAVVGYYKWYCELIGPQQYFGTRTWIMYQMEFRVRG